jgi:RNA polymerase primary sigma factor
MIDFISEEPVDNYGIFDIELHKLKKTINDTLTILDKRERGIIECYYGINRDCEPMTLEAIGDKYNLTKERIRQIKEKAIRRLRHNNDELYMLLNR